jgi:PrtD family type I secretion system ABC transporter
MAKSEESISHLEAAVRACRGHFVLAAMFSALVNVLYLAPTLYMLQVYDRVVPTRGVETLAFLTLIFTFAVATLSTLDFVRSRLLIRANLRLDRIVSPQIIAAVLARDGPQSSQALRDFDALRATLTGGGVLALFDAPWTPIYIVICFLIHPLLGALAFLGSCALLFIAAFNERATKRPLQRANVASGRAFALLDRSATATGVIHALGMRRALVTGHLLERRRSAQLTAHANFAAGAYTTLSRFTRLLLQSIALGLGAYLAIEQQISAGAIFAASLLVNRALAPTEQVVGAWRGIVQARATWRTVGEMLDSQEETGGRTRLPTPTGRLNVERVSIATPTRDRLLVHDVSFALEPGQGLGIVGASGAGKSTLVRAIAGAQPLIAGSVRFDGADARDWDQEQLARSIGYAPQDPTLFHGTIKDNIARFTTIADARDPSIDEAVVRAAIACGAHEFILRLPSAYDTELGLGGVTLSAGQAQRIALARALYREPKVLVLDEPNAHLDAVGEADLQEALLRARQQGVTVVVVAQRMGILSVVDNLMVIADGRIEQVGPRDEVMKRLSGPRPARAVETSVRPEAARPMS